MNQLEKILIGHDLRGGGETAFQSGIALASRCGAGIRLVHVVEPHHLYRHMSHPLAERGRTERTTERAGAKLEELAVSSEVDRSRVEYEVRTGKPFVELILASRAWHANLIIVGAPSRRQGRLLGSTGERVARKAPVPVLVAKTPLNPAATRILVPTDFSSGAEKAAREALAVAGLFEARIFLLHVLDTTPIYTYGAEEVIAPALPTPLPRPEDVQGEWDGMLSSLSLKNVKWENRTEEGRPADKIVEQAEIIKADLIVMGTHGRSGLTHMLLGSVAEEVTRAAPCPVLTIRPEAFQFELP